MHLRTARRNGSLGLASCLMFGGASLAGDLTIADLAPSNAIFVVGIDQFDAWKGDVDRAGFGAILEDQRIRDWFENVSQEFLPEFKGELEELGIDLEELSWPHGAVGLASWFDLEDLEKSHLLAIADFGESAATIDEMLVEALERRFDQGSIELRDDDFDGVTVWGVKGFQIAGDAPDFDDLDAGLMDELPLDEPEELFYARSGDYLLIAASSDVMEDSLSAIAGEEIDALRDNDEYQQVRSRIDGDALYAMVLAKPLFRSAAAVAQAEDEDDAADARFAVTMLRSLGLASMQGAAMSIAFDTDDGMMEMKFAILADDKSGFLSLFDAQPIGFEPPSFITADVSSASMMLFNFDRVIPLFNEVAAMLPPEQQASMQQMSMMVVPMLEPILASIGPEVVAATQLERPFTAASQRQTWAIRVKDQQALTQALTGVFAMMQFQPREFQGNQIWSSMPGGMLPADQFSIGIGLGFLFLGPTDSVENALRQAGAGADGAPRLVDDDRFRRAIQPLGGEATMFGFTDTKQSIEWGQWYLEHLDEILADQIQQLGVDDEQMDDAMREEMMEAARGSIPVWLRTIPPLDVIAEHFGDSVFESCPTPAGFEGRALWLRADE